MRRDTRSADSWTTLEVGGDEPGARARWLERAIVGLDLPAVITELAAIAGRPADLTEVPPESVRSWLGPDATAVLERGLGGLPRRKLDELFRRPGLLAGLQELAFTEGGPYWNGLVRQDDATNVVVAKHRNAVLGRLGPSATSPRRSPFTPGNVPVAATGRPLDAPPASGRLSERVLRLLYVLVPLAAAAVVLVAVLLPSLWR